MNRFAEHFETLSESEKRVCKYIFDNAKKVNDLNVYMIAEEAFTSKTVVINTAKKLGFEGFTDLKYYIRQTLNKPGAVNTTCPFKADFNDEIIENVKMTCNFVGKNELSTTADLITNAKTVYVSARGTSKAVAKHLNHMLITIGIKSVLIDDYNLLSLIASRIDKREVIVLISLSGETRKIVEAARAVKMREANIIAITSFSHNTLSKLADSSIFCVSSNTDTMDNDAISRIGMFVAVEMICNKVKSVIGI